MHTPASPDDTTALPEAPEPECERCDDGMVASDHDVWGQRRHACTCALGARRTVELLGLSL